jgi:predicted TPR repeat methyltransferase
VNAHNNLGGVLKSLGQNQAAIDTFLNVLEIDSQNVDAAHMLNVLEKKNINSIPKAYIKNLFEAFAPVFDKSLMKKLNYKAPKILKKLLTEQDCGTFGATLNLGFGTGLMGANIKGLSDDITGVDLSSKMLNLAAQLGVYTDL